VSDPYVGTRTLMRAFLDAVLPPGAIWRPAPGGDFDHFLDGLGDNLQATHDAIVQLAYIRDPWRTPFLDELEREYGVTPNAQLSESTRRAYLASVKYGRNRKSTLDTLQRALDDAGLGVGGYGLMVFANDPPVDPAPFMGFTYQMYLGGGNTQYLGYNTGGITRAFLGVASGGGVWLVNGEPYVPVPNYESLGGAQSYLGYLRSGTTGGYYLGQYYSVSYLPITVASPSDPTTWPCVFFLAAAATRAYPNLIDRGDCESATPPMVSGETVPYKSNNPTWAQSTDGFSGWPSSGTHSFKFTQTADGLSEAGLTYGIGAGTGLHGFIPGHTYTISKKFYIPSASGILGTQVGFQFGYRNSGANHGNTPVCANLYDQVQVLSTTITLPSDTTDVWIFELGSGLTGQYFYVDDITLNDVTLGPPISALTMATIPANLRQRLVEIVMRWKPLHTWAALMVSFS